MNIKRESIPPYNIRLTRVRGRISSVQVAAIDDIGKPIPIPAPATAEASIVLLINSLRFMLFTLHGKCIGRHGDEVDGHSYTDISGCLGKIH